MARIIQKADRLKRRGALSEALALYQSAVQLAPRDLSFRIRLGMIQARLGDVSGALRTLEWVRRQAGESRADRLRANLVMIWNRERKR
ncbi:tetratricopeptide repeat protein [Myxococcota bacterium]